MFLYIFNMYPLNIKYYSKNVITRSLLIFLHIKTHIFTI